jgi:hypothetical protein
MVELQVVTWANGKEAEIAITVLIDDLCRGGVWGRTGDREESRACIEVTLKTVSEGSKKKNDAKKNVSFKRCKNVRIVRDGFEETCARRTSAKAGQGNKSSTLKTFSTEIALRTVRALPDLLRRRPTPGRA